MAVCDVCNRPGMGTIVKAKDMSEAVRRGFNPFKEGLALDLMASLGMGNSYDVWRAEAISGRLSRTDWNICDGCMEKLRPYLPKPSSGQKSTRKRWWEFWKKG